MEAELREPWNPMGLSGLSGAGAATAFVALPTMEAWRRTYGGRAARKVIHSPFRK
jgi:hypothetical protein